MREDQLQIAVARYLDGIGYATRKLFFCHPPNSIYTYKAQAGKHKAYGMKAGMPDCVVFLDTGKALFIELKTKRSYLSQAQKKTQAILKALDFPVYTVKAENISDGINQVEEILKQNGVQI